MCEIQDGGQHFFRRSLPVWGMGFWITNSIGCWTLVSFLFAPWAGWCLFSGQIVTDAGGYWVASVSTRLIPPLLRNAGTYLHGCLDPSLGRILIGVDQSRSIIATPANPIAGRYADVSGQVFWPSSGSAGSFRIG